MSGRAFSNQSRYDYPDTGGFTVSGVSILSFSLLVDASKAADLHWDAIISCEFLGHYKPDPLAYQKAVELLGIPDPIDHIGNAKATLSATRLGYPHAANHPRSVASLQETPVAESAESGASCPEATTGYWWQENTTLPPTPSQPFCPCSSQPVELHEEW